MNALVGLAGEGAMRLATTTLQVTLLLLLAGLITLLLARSAAALRHLVWAVALASAFLLPVASPQCGVSQYLGQPASAVRSERKSPATSSLPRVGPLPRREIIIQFGRISE